MTSHLPLHPPLQTLKKMGLKAQDTCELFFEDVQLPEDALLGEADKGFYYLMNELPQVTNLKASSQPCPSSLPHARAAS